MYAEKGDNNVSAVGGNDRVWGAGAHLLHGDGGGWDRHYGQVGDDALEGVLGGDHLDGGGGTTSSLAATLSETSVPDRRRRPGRRGAQ